MPSHAPTVSEAEAALSKHTSSCPASDEPCAETMTIKLPDSEGKIQTIIYDFKMVWHSLPKDEQHTVPGHDQGGQRLMADLYFAKEREREARKSLSLSAKGESDATPASASGE